jgi:ribosomal protein S18 acetylase RimI-like enzyme
MLIRSMLDADIPAAAALLRRAAEEFILHDSSPQDAAAFLAEQGEQGLRGFVAAGYVYHVALIEGELAGFAGVRARTHLYSLYVDKRFQRRGIARALWDAARAAALEGAPDHPRSFTVNASDHAVPWYAAQGFVPCSEAHGAARMAPAKAPVVRSNPMRLILP